MRVVMQMDGIPKNEAKLKVDVSDSGIGMSEEDIAGLFRPFSQADTSAHRRFGGTGLGLTISKRLAKMLGGDITVTSIPEKGSTFSLTIATGLLGGTQPIPPVANAAEENSQPASSPAKLDCRILLAEDGPDNQRLIARFLRNAGAEVIVADNGQIAVELALTAQHKGNPFDIILMDMQMPVLDGCKATQQLRATGYTGPIIALTASAMSGDRAKCLAAGCDDYTSKPIDRTLLLDAVTKHLEQRQFSSR